MSDCPSPVSGRRSRPGACRRPRTSWAARSGRAFALEAAFQGRPGVAAAAAAPSGAAEGEDPVAASISAESAARRERAEKAAAAARPSRTTDVQARIVRDAIAARQDATAQAAVLEAEESASAALAERLAAVTP